MIKSRKLKLIASAFICTLALAFTAFLPATDVNADDSRVFRCLDGSTATGGDYNTACSTSNASYDTGSGDLWGTANTIINIIIGIVGFLAVFMIIFGGIQYTISAGDAGKVTKAKNTILYGVVGLVIALLAYAIVNFILSNVFTSSSSGVIWMIK